MSWLFKAELCAQTDAQNFLASCKSTQDFRGKKDRMAKLTSRRPSQTARFSCSFSHGSWVSPAYGAAGRSSAARAAPFLGDAQWLERSCKAIMGFSTASNVLHLHPYYV